MNYMSLTRFEKLKDGARKLLLSSSMYAFLSPIDCNFTTCNILKAYFKNVYFMAINYSCNTDTIFKHIGFPYK